MWDTWKCIFHKYKYKYIDTLRHAHDCKNRLVKQAVKHTYKTMN